ncbi:hypothetical protein Dimus_013713 [Dionaea muscipula]
MRSDINTKVKEHQPWALRRSTMKNSAMEPVLDCSKKKGDLLGGGARRSIPAKKPSELARRGRGDEPGELARCRGMISPMNLPNDNGDVHSDDRGVLSPEIEPGVGEPDESAGH